MSLYSLGTFPETLNGGLDNTPFWEICAAEFARPALLEMQCHSLIGSKVSLVLGRTSIKGSGPKGSYFQALIPGDPPGQTFGAVDWETWPTQPTNFLRRVILGSSGNALVAFQIAFPRGLVIAAAGSLCLWAVLGGTNTNQVGLSAVVNE